MGSKGWSHVWIQAACAVRHTSPSNNNFGTQLQMHPGWQLDMVVLDPIGQEFNGAMSIFARDKNLSWPRSQNEFFDLATYDMREITGDVGLDLGLVDLNLFNFSVPRSCSR